MTNRDKPKEQTRSKRFGSLSQLRHKRTRRSVEHVSPGGGSLIFYAFRDKQVARVDSHRVHGAERTGQRGARTRRNFGDLRKIFMRHKRLRRHAPRHKQPNQQAQPDDGHQHQPASTHTIIPSSKRPGQQDLPEPRQHEAAAARCPGGQRTRRCALACGAWETKPCVTHSQRREEVRAATHRSCLPSRPPSV